MLTDLALDALEQAIQLRPMIERLVHHSDGGSQHLSIRDTERLAECGTERFVGTTGDPADNALTESAIGLFKTEVTRPEGPWKGFEAIEPATLGPVDWCSHRRSFEALGDIPHAEFEQPHDERRAAVWPKPPGLRWTRCTSPRQADSSAFSCRAECARRP